jgi:hypothetical protein
MTGSMIASAVRYMESIKDKVPPAYEEAITVKPGTTHLKTLGLDPHKMVKDVNKLKTKGMTIKDACEQVGMTRDQYYKTKKGITNKK